MSEDRFCVNCKWHYVGNSGDRVCLHMASTQVDLVTAGYRKRSCREMRDGGPCGSEGKLYGHQRDL